ncbi:MAG TPA: 3'-5' exonuclease [Acidimicrobiales bacterium]|nr:3'-5' exonuclease [Acidimicrobiales bacterium]
MDAPPLHGLDIETDTEAGGLDPRVARIVAVAVASESSTRVFDGDETELLRSLDLHIAALPPGVLVTWNGGAFDLPFLEDRATACGVRLGLRLTLDRNIWRRGEPLPGHDGAYRAAWYGNTHLDAYQAYKAVVRQADPDMSCGLKSLAKRLGYDPVEVDASHLHELTPSTIRGYVASDAEVTRTMAARMWTSASGLRDDRTVTRASGGQQLLDLDGVLPSL